MAMGTMQFEGSSRLPNIVRAVPVGPARSARAGRGGVCAFTSLQKRASWLTGQTIALDGGTTVFLTPAPRPPRASAAASEFQRRERVAQAPQGGAQVRDSALSAR